MSRETNIGGHTSGRSGDVGGSTSGGKAGDEQFNAYGEDVRTGQNPVSKEEAEQADTDQLHGVPDDLKPGTRKTVGLDEDAGGGDNEVSGIPGSTSGQT